MRSMRVVIADDYRGLARRRLPRAIFDFVEGGAGDESSVRANRRGFDRITFRPRPLVGVAHRDLHVEVFANTVSMPVLLAPAGSTRLVHRDGEIAVAKAAARIGTIYVLSATSNFTLEEVAAAAPEAMLWFQIYLWQDKKLVADLVRRASEAGFLALCVTVDVPMSGMKDRDMRNGLTIPPRLTVSNALDTCRRARWMRDFVLGPRITFKNLEPYGFDMGGGVMALGTLMQKRLHDPSSTWEDVRWVRSLWHGPLVVKGVLTKEAAEKAFAVGADGVICSNHGGRQLAGSPATIDVLPEIVDVGARLNKDVFIDGGVRRGYDVVKALALGAKACLIGRPYHWGLAVEGEQGVLRVLEIFEREIDNVLAQIGQPLAAEVCRDAVAVSHE